MLAIRLQRTGRKGHAQYRVIVQDSHRSPTSGRVVAYLGSYDPHTKVVTLKKDQAQTFLDNGAQPSDRVVGLLKGEGIKLPKWVSVKKPIKRDTRTPEKLRRNQPAEAKPVAEEKPAEDSEASPAPEPAIDETPDKTDQSSTEPENASDEVVEKDAVKTEEVPSETVEPGAGETKDSLEEASQPEKPAQNNK